MTSVVLTNLPTAGGRPEIEGGSNPWPCQVHSGTWVPGRGFVFTYCVGQQEHVISWSVADRWRTRRTLRICARHGAAFAAQHGLASAGMPVAPDAPDHGQQPVAPIAPSTDADQPFDRVRERA